MNSNATSSASPSAFPTRYDDVGRIVAEKVIIEMDRTEVSVCITCASMAEALNLYRKLTAQPGGIKLDVGLK